MVDSIVECMVVDKVDSNTAERNDDLYDYSLSRDLYKLTVLLVQLLPSLVVKPGMIARGKEEIKKAFIAIAKYFNNSIVPTQGEMIILEAGDTALVLSQTILEADKEESEYSMDRRATYVFKKNSQGKWLCAIDNSYGTELISK